MKSRYTKFGFVLFFVSSVLAEASLPPSSAQASLAAVSPALGSNNGFPLWYQDASGLQLIPCLGVNPDGTGAADPNCIVLPDATFNPSGPVNFPSNFPGEFFYYLADAIFDQAGTARNVRLRMALEGSFANGDPAPGEQIVFLRVGLDPITGLRPNATYTVDYPFGIFTFTADGLGNSNRRDTRFEDLGGCVAAGICDFGGVVLSASATRMGPFLKARLPAPPAGYIGNPAALQTIDPGPNGDFVKISGPDIGGPGVNSIQINQWNVMGKLNPVPTLSSVALAPASASMVLGGAGIQLSAAPKDQTGAPFPASVTWSSSDGAVASVDAAGLVTANAPGSATITATAVSGQTSVSGTSAITVAAPVLAAIAVTPASQTLLVGQTVQLQSAALDQFGSALLIQPSLFWLSSNPAVASVDAAGLVTANAPGTANINAVDPVSGKIGTAVLTVNPVPVLSSVALAPASASVPVGGVQIFSASILDQNGAAFSGASVSWSSSNPASASVSPTGVAIGLSDGRATITATAVSGATAVTGTAALTVGNPPLLCQTAADANGDGAISNLEILNYVKNWKIGTVLNLLILKAIGFWKAGAGC